MDILQQFSPTAVMILISAVVILVLVLFAKAIKFTLKLAVIAVMVLLIAYFLRQVGLI
jgi:uncharacterized membrane protein YfhO